MRASSLLAKLFAILVVTVGTEVAAKPEAEARSAAIAWLEANQNADGSWGEDRLRALATAEALNALAAAGQAHRATAKRAAAWLRNQELRNTDYRARAIRALAAAGYDVADEAAELYAEANPSGWGPSDASYSDLYDTALAVAGVATSSLNTKPLVAAELETIVDGLLARRRILIYQGLPADCTTAGWSSDHVPKVDVERTITAEIFRALSAFSARLDNYDDVEAQILGERECTIQGVVRPVLFAPPIDENTTSLELAARLAAWHTVKGTDAARLRQELLADARFTSADVWSDTDPLVNALGLLAITTRPSAVFPDGPSDDADGDGLANSDDAFPHDGDFQYDLDGDGIPNELDPDVDGDGTLASQGDVNDLDPTIATNADNVLDDDGDGISDLDELALGTDPASTDTDGDGESDSSDSCPTVAGWIDADDDGSCLPADCDDTDPLESSNLDGDEYCDGVDDDIDGDDWPNAEELAYGSDPRNPSSVPQDLASADPEGDFDGDGLTNSEESAYGTSPFLADTDSDGAPDGLEVAAATSPNSVSSQPEAVVAVFGGAGTASESDAGSPPLLTTASAEVEMSATSGQPTPTFPPGSGPSADELVVHLPGFQPQAALRRDLDGDGLSGYAEASAATSPLLVDSDGDRFTDGPDGRVATADHPELDLRDLDGDGLAEGEAGGGSDPANADDRPGKPGDVAPLGGPDGRVDVADAQVLLRILRDPALVDALPTEDAREVTLEAADVDEDDEVRVNDALRLLQDAGAR